MSSAATSRPAWYQLYLTGGIDAARSGIDRARAAGFSALVVTVDTPVAGLRERDIRNGTKELLGRSDSRCSVFCRSFSRDPGGCSTFSATAA